MLTSLVVRGYYYINSIEVKHSDKKLILMQNKSNADDKYSKIQEGKCHFLLRSSGKTSQAGGLSGVQEIPG